MLGVRDSAPLPWTGTSRGWAGANPGPLRPSTMPSTPPGGLDRLLALARDYPGWAGLSDLMAGLQSYRNAGYRRASELLRRGFDLRNDDDANHYAVTYLSRVVTRVEVAEKVEVPVLFSEESVLLALSHALRETGRLRMRPDACQLAAAVASLGPGPQLPGPDAGPDRRVVAWTEGLLNEDAPSAALLLVRARALRREGWLDEAQDAISEVLRRRGTAMTFATMPWRTAPHWCWRSAAAGCRPGNGCGNPPRGRPPGH